MKTVLLDDKASACWMEAAIFTTNMGSEVDQAASHLRGEGRQNESAIIATSHWGNFKSYISALLLTSYFFCSSLEEMRYIEATSIVRSSLLSSCSARTLILHSAL